MGPNAIWLASLCEGHGKAQRGQTHGNTDTEDGQEEGTQEDPTLWTPWSQTSSLQNYEKISVCRLCHPRDMVLWKQTNTVHWDTLKMLPTKPLTWQLNWVTSGSNVVGRPHCCGKKKPSYGILWDKWSHSSWPAESCWHVLWSDKLHKNLWNSLTLSPLPWINHSIECEDM